jgi:hypothetical protein
MGQNQSVGLREKHGRDGQIEVFLDPEIGGRKTMMFQ